MLKVTFDEQGVHAAPADCLQPQLWQKFKTPLSPSDDTEFLLKLKLLTQDQDGKVIPSVSGILMATEQPEQYLNSAYIQAVLYRNTERNAADQIDAKDITGPLDQQVRDALHFVIRNMKVGAIKNLGRRDIPQYSLKAVSEAIVNAVAHRDYSIYGSKIRLHMFADRLELYSPGAIPNTMTIDSLALRQATRNELLTSLLARCSAVEWQMGEGREYMMDKRGEGVPIILTASEKLSGKRPKYTLIDDSELLLTLYAADPHS